MGNRGFRVVRPGLLGAVACLLWLAPTSLDAQQPGAGSDPFADPGAFPFGELPADGDPFATGRPVPAAAEAEPGASPTTDGTEPTVEEPAEETDPAVLAVQESNPTTAVQLVWAAETMLKLDRPELAKAYVEQLLNSQLDAQTLVALHDHYGTAVFLRFMRDQRLAPEGGQLGSRVLQAARDAQYDISRLRGLVQQLLTAENRAKRYAALVDLRQVGSAAVPPLLEVLQSSDLATHHETVQSALVELGEPAVLPLIAAARSGDDALRALVLPLLGRLKAVDATPHLIRPYLSGAEPQAVRDAAAEAIEEIVGLTPTADEARTYLARQVQQQLGKSMAAADERFQTVELWQWEAAQNLPQPQRFTPATAAMIRAAQLAGDLHALFPDDARYRELYLLSRLELEKRVHGLDQPLSRGAGSAWEVASSMGPAAVERALSHAVESGFTPAAVAAAEVLGEIGSADLLNSPGAEVRPLAAALTAPATPLRLAAARAIMQLNPQRPYPGSSHLPETLAYFAGTSAQRQVLVAHPNPQRSLGLASMFNELGFEGQSVQRGEDLFRLAAQRPDYELIVLSRAIQTPDALHVIQMLRQDPRTAEIPIALLIEAPEQDTPVTRWAEQDPLTEIMAPPVSVDHLSLEAKASLIHAAHLPVSRAVRLRRAAWALESLGELAADEQLKFYDVLGQLSVVEQALYQPELSVAAAQVLGKLGTPAAQQLLVDFASRPVHSLAARQAAAAAFAEAVARYGILLTSDQMQRQYDRYNASERLDRETQQVLGSILDTMEAVIAQEDVGETRQG